MDSEADFCWHTWPQTVKTPYLSFAQIVDTAKERNMDILRPVTARCVEIGEEACAGKDRL